MTFEIVAHKKVREHIFIVPPEPLIAGGATGHGYEFWAVRRQFAEKTPWRDMISCVCWSTTIDAMRLGLTMAAHRLVCAENRRWARWFLCQGFVGHFTFPDSTNTLPMSIYSRAVSDLESADVAELLTEHAIENIRLEFKRELPGRDESLKKLSSFANTYGGYLVVGAEANSADGRLQALPLSSTVGSEAWNSRDLKSRPH